MDVVTGILGTAVFLAGLYALIVHVARGNRSTAGGGAWLAAVAVACVIAGAALIFAGWRLYMGPPQLEGAAPIPQAGSPFESAPSTGELSLWIKRWLAQVGLTFESAPGTGELSPASAVALVFAIAATFSLAYWLFFCLIPDVLARRRHAK